MWLWPESIVALPRWNVCWLITTWFGMQILDVNLQNPNRQKWLRHQISQTLIDQQAIPGTLNNHVLMDGNGETTIFHVMIWNHPVETVIRNWLFGVPGWSVAFITNLKRNAPSNRHVTSKISFDPSQRQMSNKKNIHGCLSNQNLQLRYKKKLPFQEGL